MLVIAVDADAEQAVVGQHFAHVDVVAALPKPQATAAQAHGLLHGVQAQPLGALFHIGGNPFAQSHAEQPGQQAYRGYGGNDALERSAAGADRPGCGYY